MSIDRAEHRPAGDASLFHPGLEDANRACLRIGAVRYTNLAAGALLVRLRSAQRDRQAVLAERAILDVEPHELRTAERSGESEQDEGPISTADDARVRRADHGPNVIRQSGSLLSRRGPLCSPDTLHHVLDHAGGCW